MGVMDNDSIKSFQIVNIFNNVDRLCLEKVFWGKVYPYLVDLFQGIYYFLPPYFGTLCYKSLNF